MRAVHRVLRALAPWFCVFLLVGCTSTHQVFEDTPTRGIPMVVTSQQASFYQGNEVIAQLPVGTQVRVLERGEVWSKVEIYVEAYKLRVQGNMHTKELAPAEGTPETTIEASTTTPSIAPALAALRDELWQEFLPGLGINCIAPAEDALWVGTDEGLYRFAGGNPQAQQVFNSGDGLADDAVLAVAPDGDQVWVGTFMGLSRLKDGDFVNYDQRDGLLKGAVMALDVTPDAVWLGLSSGIAKFDKKTQTFQNWPHGGGWSPLAGSGSAPSSSPNAIYADSLLIAGQEVWHAAFNLTQTGFDGRDLKTYGCGDGLIHSRVVDFGLEGEMVWVATINGLSLLDTSVSKKYERFSTNRGTDDNPIVAAVRDGEGLWIAQKEGLSRFDLKKKKFTTYYAVWDLFDGRYISTLAVEPQYLWIGTVDGLWRLDKTLAQQFSDEGLVDDFESPSRIRQRNWPIYAEEPNGRTRFQIDDSDGANGTRRSLRVIYVAPDYREHTLAHIGVNLADLDMTDADGIRFFVRAEPAVGLTADLHEDRETWSVGHWNVPNTWMEVRVPFSQLQVHAQSSGNRILELYAIGYLSFRVSRSDRLGNKPEPGQRGSVWIDEIRFYKEKAPSLAGR